LLKLGAYPAYRLLTRYRARQHVDGLFAYSEFMRAAHEGHVPGPTAHIHLGIDLTGLPTERPQRPRTPLRFGFAGGFQPHKGIGQILDAASVLRRRGVRFEIHVWGPDQEAGAREVSARGLDGAVVVRGMFAADTLWAAYAEMDVLLMATQDNEPFGRVIQEAAAMGAPSIAPAIGGIAEQIKDDVDGLLYGFRDGADLVRQMERVLREPGLFARLSSNLWRVVDTRDTIAAVEEFYRDVIRRSAKVRATS
jgi:glycosyltransferase involved in cell wall biosynthesis